MTASFGLVTIYFKWLLGSFKRLENSVKEIAISAHVVEDNTKRMLENHEVKDQTRHEENLYRFEKISVALARLGSSNGTYGKEKN